MPFVGEGWNHALCCVSTLTILFSFCVVCPFPFVHKDWNSSLDIVFLLLGLKHCLLFIRVLFLCFPARVPASHHYYFFFTLYLPLSHSIENLKLLSPYSSLYSCSIGIVFMCVNEAYVGLSFPLFFCIRYVGFVWMESVGVFLPYITY